MTVVYVSVMWQYEPSRHTLRLFATLQGGEMYLRRWVMLNQHSPHRTLFHFFIFFFSFKAPHIYLSMLSRHLKISKPIWHYLHHGRPLKFASVEWVWQAITPMQDIGNLTRICSDKSGRSGGGVPPGGREGRQRGGAQLYSRKHEE